MQDDLIKQLNESDLIKKDYSKYTDKNQSTKIDFRVNTNVMDDKKQYLNLSNKVMLLYANWQKKYRLY